MSTKQAQAYHSINIGDKNTWDDWHLVPTSRPTVAMPDIKTNFVEVPGRSGALDLSEALTGSVVYGMRSGSFDFLVMNDYGSWETRYSVIASYLHGRRFQVVLDDDPGYYYTGRLSLEPWQPGKSYSTISIKYELEPYKIEKIASDEDWVWDDFNFEYGVIRVYTNIAPTNNGIDFHVNNDIMPVIPTIIASTSGISVTFKGELHTLIQGNNQIRDIKLDPGDNVLRFTGNSGTVSISFHSGRL